MQQHGQINNRTFSARGHMVQNPTYWRARECDKTPLGNVNKEKSHFPSYLCFILESGTFFCVSCTMYHVSAKVLLSEMNRMHSNHIWSDKRTQQETSVDVHVDVCLVVQGRVKFVADPKRLCSLENCCHCKPHNQSDFRALSKILWESGLLTFMHFWIFFSKASGRITSPGIHLWTAMQIFTSYVGFNKFLYEVTWINLKRIHFEKVCITFAQVSVILQ